MDEALSLFVILSTQYPSLNILNLLTNALIDAVVLTVAYFVVLLLVTTLRATLMENPDRAGKHIVQC